MITVDLIRHTKAPKTINRKGNVFLRTETIVDVTRAPAAAMKNIKAESKEG